MEKDFRNEVLEMSLTVEEMLSKLLFFQFKVTKEECKTLSYKSSALSFRNKVDLLLDLNKFTSKTYKSLICFMEIRNQFMHNKSSSNILIAAERVDKTKFLISFSEEAKSSFKNNLNESLKITGLEISFINLYGEILNAISEIHESFQKELDREKEDEDKKNHLEIMKEALKQISESIDFISDQFDEVFASELSDSKKGRFKNAVFAHFSKNILSKYKSKS